MSKLLMVSLLFSLMLLSAWKFLDTSKTITWELNSYNQIGGYTPTILGNPILHVEGVDTAMYFNGVNDGLVIPAIPIKGWRAFTIEVLFKPDSDGPIAPRFIHFEDTLLNRGTFELRLTKDKQWYFDGFLRNGITRKGITLIDSTQLHPADQWHWAALVYDGQKMYSYINGQKELEAAMDLPPMTIGNLALGVRLNKVSWFKGQIKTVLFHADARKAKDLQRLYN